MIMLTSVPRSIAGILASVLLASVAGASFGATSASAGGIAGFPENDECPGAIVLPEGTSGPFDNSSASSSTPPFLCFLAEKDLWFAHTAACTGTLEVSLCGLAAFDTVVQVYSGSCANLISLGCNDDACGLQSRIEFSVVQGTAYWIRIAGLGSSAGEFSIFLDCDSSAGDETEYPGEFSVSTKPDKALGLAKVKTTTPSIFEKYTSFQFDCDPIRDGTWAVDARGKLSADISIQDLQRILEDVYGTGVVTVSSLLSSKTQLKVKEGRNGKPGTVQLAVKARVLVQGGLPIDVQIKFKGAERDL
ncbi:MAG: hypothetical protein JNM84_01090 [Planctomycetes bacterium]|nr:hypothetical protein [Planctomycetota bacterium]